MRHDNDFENFGIISRQIRKDLNHRYMRRVQRMDFIFAVIFIAIFVFLAFALGDLSGT